MNAVTDKPNWTAKVRSQRSRVFMVYLKYISSSRPGFDEEIVDKWKDEA